MTTRRTTAASILVALLFALVLSACGGGDEVGDSSLLDFDASDQAALGVTTTTAAGETTTTKPAQAKITTTTAAPVQKTTTTLPPDKETVTLEVTINASSPYFKPGVVEVLVGSKVRFINKDSQPHSVVADNGSFDSGPIPPNGVFVYTANQRGQFNYSDGTRPFAVGVIDVQ